MPKWGLTAEQRRTRPWGLEESLLQPDKTITDPIHGDIYLTKLERVLVDSPPMQRLRRVRQLGTTHLVYPGATHSRFSHALGALRAAQDLLDAVFDQRHGPGPALDLFSEWEADPEVYRHNVAEATVLARLGALLHDLCHVPFGHSIEDDLGILEAHDKNASRYETLWSKIPAIVRDVIPSALATAIRPLILSKEDPRGAAEPATRYPFVADIVGNTICADLLDYLPRDHYYTGLPAKLGDRFVSGFYVTRSDHPYYPRRMAMRITRAGRDRDDAVSELFKYLRYRYELSERALVHHAKVAADAMVGKALEMWSDATWIAEALKIHPDLVKASVADIDETRRAITGSAPSTVADIDRATRDRLEAELLRHGDDGLLEHLLYSAEKESSTDKRLAGVVSLTTGLLYRKLFKRSGLCRSARPNAARIYKTHGSPAARRRLEREAAKYAGLDHSWQVLVWIPDPDMRLKAAEVLVDDARTVCPLVDLDNVGSNRGREIYESHKALWAVSVFVHPSVSPERRSVLLGRLSERIGGIKWDNLKDQPSVTRLAAYRVGAERKLARVDENMLAEQAEGLAARKGGATFEDLVRELHQVAEMRWSKGERLS